MVKAKRNERIAVITRILCENPGKLFNLFLFFRYAGSHEIQPERGHFRAEGAFFEARGLGRIETIPGAAGGVKIYSGGFSSAAGGISFGTGQDAERFAAGAFGGYIYMTDLMNNPEQLGCMAQALIKPFINKKADFILTMETKGIPIALMTARALNLPLVVARRENRINEGSLVTINYLFGLGQINADHVSAQTGGLGRSAGGYYRRFYEGGRLG